MLAVDQNRDFVLQMFVMRNDIVRQDNILLIFVWWLRQVLFDEERIRWLIKCNHYK